MSTPSEEIEATLADAAGEAEQGSVDAGEASPAEAESNSDDVDLGNEFASLDAEFASEFDISVPDSEEQEDAAAAAVADPEPDATALTEEVEVEGADAAPATEARPAPTLEETQAELVRVSGELETLRSATAEEVAAEGEGQPESGDGTATYQAMHEAAHTQLMEQYALTQEDADSIVTQPETIVPRLMANMHLNVLQSTMLAIRQELPGWLKYVQGESNLASAEQAAFDAMWPKLKDHPDDVKRIKAVYRDLNPDAAAEQVVREVGAQVMLALGLVADAETASAAEAAPPPQRPHRPAARRTSPSGGKGKAANEFAEMAEEADDGL